MIEATPRRASYFRPAVRYPAIQLLLRSSSSVRGFDGEVPKNRHLGGK
jgi:hypothetical protein